MWQFEDKNCLMSARGTEYAGTTTEGNDKEQCKFWDNTNTSADHLTFISDTNEILYGLRTLHSNQCRNLNEDPLGPWCYNSTNQRIYCNISYCG